MKDGAGSAGPGTLEAADVTLEVDSEHGPTIFGGDMATVQKLYFGGTLKIAGNVMASNKLAALATMDKQLVEDARKARVAAGGGGAAAPAASAAAAPAASQEATLGDLFTAIAAEIADKPEVVAKGKTVFQFEFDNPESSYFIDLKNAPGSAGPGKADAADVTIAVDTALVGTLFGGDMAAVQKLYFGGQIKISGNVMASNKLAALAGMDKSRVEKARQARLAAGAPAAAAPVAMKEPKKALAAEALAKLEANLAGKSGGAGVVQLRVKDPDGVWSVDLGANPPSVTQGERSDAGATITLGDAQLAALVNGESKMQELFQKGALTIDGNITLARQLEQATGASK
ncbi:MAG: SCP2 sterol-binding domain-containing protein [Sandaracinaceae bacterium]|nr:SCP2 sterol-binding domain-containing protein [Sandaracinaceae bacterium]